MTEINMVIKDEGFKIEIIKNGETYFLSKNKGKYWILDEKWGYIWGEIYNALSGNIKDKWVDIMDEWAFYDNGDDSLDSCPRYCAVSPDNFPNIMNKLDKIIPISEAKLNYIDKRKEAI